MGRDNSQPFDSGRRGFREPDEPIDERPCIVRAPFWKDAMEAATYLTAVQMNPQKSTEGPFAYIERLSSIVTKEQRDALHDMPRARPTKREWSEAQEDVKMRAAGDDWRG